MNEMIDLWQGEVCTGKNKGNSGAGMSEKWRLVRVRGGPGAPAWVWTLDSDP